MSDKKQPPVYGRIERTNSVFPSREEKARSSLGYGEPILRVYDQKTGALIGYTDWSGNPVTRDGVSLAHAAAVEQKKLEERAKHQKSYQREVAAYKPLHDQPITVDGVLQRPFGMTLDTAGAKADLNTGKVTDKDGNDITKSVLGAVAAQQGKASSVFSGLNLPDAIVPTAQFLMSRGDAETIDPATGLKVTPHPVDNMNANRRAVEKNATPVAPTENMMTIQEGVRWLRKLSVDQPDLYDAMVVRLRNANYIQGKDTDLPLHGWSTAVGQAFALAMNDLAGANQEGENRTMSEWLDMRGKSFADSLATADAYTPKDRHYTDPTALAASARSAAEQALGRGLTDAEAAQFAAKFKSLEDANYNAIDAAGRAKGSATVTDPNAAGQAEAFVRSPQFDADRGKQLVGSYMDAFKSLMGL